MRVIVTTKARAINTLSRAYAEAAVKTAYEMRKEVWDEGVMPFDTGSMQNESTQIDDVKVTKGKVQIVTDKPYARRLYFHPEYAFNTSKNANARAEWWEDWLTGAKASRPAQLFKAFYRKITGGYVK